jgi:NAD(P)-dependent dehydrogenase (short-subunit alcohol dehydrogenase family)
MSIDLNGRTALVTGGSRGIGAAIARSLAKAGAAVAVNYRERADQADTLVKEIVGAGGRAAAYRADVSEPRPSRNWLNVFKPNSALSISSSTMPISPRSAASTSLRKMNSTGPSR